MRRKIVVSALLFIVSSFVTPALFACESCWPANVKDPSGGISSRIRCYASNDGMWEICTVKEDYSGCNTDDTDPTACPISGGGGQTGGAGGTGSGGSTCSTAATGACPPDCRNCGGGGSLY
jgi:hypothetical protein